MLWFALGGKKKRGRGGKANKPKSRRQCSFVLFFFFSERVIASKVYEEEESVYMSQCPNRCSLGTGNRRVTVTLHKALRGWYKIKIKKVGSIIT